MALRNGMSTRHPNPGPGPAWNPDAGWYEDGTRPNLQPLPEEPARPAAPSGKPKRWGRRR